MGARSRLNEIHVVGSLALAGFIGIATGSFIVFAVTGATLIAAGLYVGDIRPNKDRRK